MASSSSSSAPPIRWASDFSSKFVIAGNFQRRGWQEVPVEGSSSDVWDICWASVGTAKALFAAESTRLRQHQRVNHFPNHYELTRKDLLAKNIKRYQRLARKSGAALPSIIPSTFVLPQDYALFVEEFRQESSPTPYILKPRDKAQGKGIFIINKLSQVHSKAAAAAGPHIPPLFDTAGTANDSRRGSSGTGGSAAPPRPALEDCVVSRYIDSPLLLGGKKFDLRLYVLVVSFRPLVVYMSTLGFCRFCSVRYSREVAQLDNALVHLTNVAVQKGSSRTYNSSHGNKFPLDNLRLHLEATHGHAAAAQLFASVKELTVHTLKAVQQAIIQDKHCFELYGFDVIIDSQLQPWLVEVNASPSLTTTTKADRLLKFKVVNDAISVVTAATWSHSSTTADDAAVDADRRVYPQALGSMQLICDESTQQDGTRSQRTSETEQQRVQQLAGGRKGSSRSLPCQPANAVPLPTISHVRILHG